MDKSNPNDKVICDSSAIVKKVRKFEFSPKSQAIRSLHNSTRFVSIVNTEPHAFGRLGNFHLFIVFTLIHVEMF